MFVKQPCGVSIIEVANLQNKSLLPWHGLIFFPQSVSFAISFAGDGFYGCRHFTIEDETMVKRLLF